MSKVAGMFFGGRDMSSFELKSDCVCSKCNSKSKEKSKMFIYYSDDFTGHYPVGTALVVRASSRIAARRLASKSLKEKGLVFDGSLTLISNKLPPACHILCDGNY